MNDFGTSFIPHTPTICSVTVYEATEAEAEWEMVLFLVGHPSADFGPLHPAARGWVAHGTFNPKDA